MNNDGLRPYERHVGCALAAVLLAFSLTVWLHGSKEIPQVAKEKVTVLVKGAVQEEKEITVDRGSRVDDVLAMVELLDDADLLELNGMKKIVNNTLILVPYKEKLTLYLYGAVKPEVVVLKKGATAQEVLNHVQVEKDANIQGFLRRKSFKNGSTIEIKRKKTGRKKAS